MKKISDVVAEFLKEKKIKHVFGIVGAGNVHLFDSINKLGYTEIICVHHEQAAVMSMIGYYRATNKLSAAIVTTGGGSTNTFTGVISGWMDSIPGLIIAGNENSKFTSEGNPLRIWGVQGYDSVAMAEKYTKFSARLLNATEANKLLNLAYEQSISGRSGPSWLEIPMDVQAQTISGDMKRDLTLQPEIQHNIESHLNTIQKLLSESKRPVLWLGHGIRLSGASNLVETLVNKFKIPVLLSWAGIDLLDVDNQYNFGSAGVYGLRSANFILQNSDLLITIGTRLSIMQVGHDVSEFARNAKLVVNDIDHDEVFKLGDRVTLPVICNSRLFVSKLIDSICTDECSFEAWLNYCDTMREKYPRVGFDNQDKNGYINSHKFIEKLSSYLNSDQLICTDMGTALISAHQALLVKYGQRLFTSTGLGEMGYGLPAAIGASIGSHKSKVICLNCDGGMMLNLQELQTMVHHKLPIKLFIFTNDGYLMIKHTQKALFGGKYSATNAASGVTCPDYKKIAGAFNIDYCSIKTWQDFEREIHGVITSDQSYICEVFIDPEQPLVPKLSLSIGEDGKLVSPPLEDLSPLIPFDELQQNMLISVHEKSIALFRA